MSDGSTTMTATGELTPAEVHVPSATEPKKRAPKATHELGTLNAKKRNALPARAFALPKTKQYPIHDKAHVRNAAARLEQNRSRLTPAEYREAKKNIARAAKRFGIDSKFAKKGAATMADSVFAGSIEVALSDDAPKQVWIQIAKPGTFKGHPAGPFALDGKVFDQIVRNFKATQNQSIPIDFEHASEADPTSGSIPVEGAPAQGWIRDLKIQGGNLYGLVEWGQRAREYIKSGQYKYFSPAIRFNSRDRVTGDPIGARMTSGALTNNPYLDGMAPLAARDAAQGDAVRAAGERASRSLKLLHSTNEYMPHIRNALGLHDLADARECGDALDRLEEAHARSGGAEMYQGMPVGRMTKELADMVRAPMNMHAHQMFDAVREMIAAAIKEHEATDHPDDGDGDDDDDDEKMADYADDGDENQDEVGMADNEGETIMGDKNEATLLSEERAKTAELTLKLAESNALVTRLTDENKGLRESVEKRDQAELESEVDEVIAVHASSKGLTKESRPHLLTFAKANRDAFRAMYPKIKPEERHLVMNLTGRRDTEAKDTVVAGEAMTLTQLTAKLMRDEKLSFVDAQDKAMSVLGAR